MFLASFQYLQELFLLLLLLISPVSLLHKQEVSFDLPFMLQLFNHLLCKDSSKMLLHSDGCVDFHLHYILVLCGQQQSLLGLDHVNQIDLLNVC